MAAIALIAMAGAGSAAVNSVAAVSLLDGPTPLPRFIERPSAAEFSGVYPRGAASVGMGGRALLHCDVAHGGQLEKCHVMRDAPEGAGFGGAAMSLSHYFRLDPNSDAAQAGQFDLPIGFAMATDEDRQLAQGPWIRAPTFADVAAAYPDIGGGVTGQVFVHCGLERDGSLNDCKALYEMPVDREFDIAALKLTHLFRMRIADAVLKTHQPLSANVLLRIAAPFTDEGKERLIADPVWLAAPSFARLAALFPAQASAKSVTSGVGVAACTVGADGSLGACQPFGPGEPPGLGFSEAAAKAAPEMRMAPWTDDGGPVDGAAVHVAIRFTSVTQ
ncbi:MAG: hypothetical protein ACREEB_05075 [Caulobacteraceae bacterium]